MVRSECIFKKQFLLLSLTYKDPRYTYLLTINQTQYIFEEILNASKNLREIR